MNYDKLGSLTETPHVYGKKGGGKEEKRPRSSTTTVKIKAWDVTVSEFLYLLEARYFDESTIMFIEWMNHSASRGHSLEKLRLVFSDNCHISVQKPANASQLSTNASGLFPVPTRHFTQISMSSANGTSMKLIKFKHLPIKSRSVFPLYFRHRPSSLAERLATQHKTDVDLACFPTGFLWYRTFCLVPCHPPPQPFVKIDVLQHVYFPDQQKHEPSLTHANAPGQAHSANPAEWCK